VRCPSSKIDGRIGRIIKNFYSHLARLIYAKAQSWRPVNVAQLQEYVDSERQGHYLEGGMSEFIMPNWAIYSRESTLYADIEQHEDGAPVWSDPTRFSDIGMRIRLGHGEQRVEHWQVARILGQVEPDAGVYEQT